MDQRACGRCKYWFVGEAPKSIRPETLGQCRWGPAFLIERGSFFAHNNRIRLVRPV